MTIEETVDVYIGKTNSDNLSPRRYMGLYYSGLRGDEHDRIRGSDPLEFVDCLKKKDNLRSKRINLLRKFANVSPSLFSFFEISEEEFQEFKKAIEGYNTSLESV